MDILEDGRTGILLGSTRTQSNMRRGGPGPYTQVLSPNVFMWAHTLATPTWVVASPYLPEFEEAVGEGHAAHIIKAAVDLNANRNAESAAKALIMQTTVDAGMDHVPAELQKARDEFLPPPQ